MPTNKQGALKPIIIFFILLNSLFIIFRANLASWQIDQNVLILGNLFLFIITLISFIVAKKGLQHKNPHAFMRSVMGSIMIKMFLALIVAFIYIATFKKELNKPALFICMGLYLIYTFMEVSALTRILRRKPHE